MLGIHFLSAMTINAVLVLLYIVFFVQISSGPTVPIITGFLVIPVIVGVLYPFCIWKFADRHNKRGLFYTSTHSDSHEMV